MFLYRDHRGGLAEAMDTVQEMESYTDLVRHITRVFGTGEVTVKPYGYDKRIDWDTHIVCFNGQGVGFTNAPVKALAPDQAT